MLMSNFLKSRSSIREYKNKKIDGETRASILKIFEDLEEEAGGKYFNFILFEEGERVYGLLKGLAGYSGVMIESPHYIGVRLKEVNDESIINASYYAEKLMTKLSQLNLGSCWVNVKDVDKGIRAQAFGEENKNIGYIIAFGYPKAKNPFLHEPFSSRVNIQDIVFDEEIGRPISMEKLENRGLDDLFYYIRFAPSNYNKQPWRFILKNDRVILLLESSEDGKTDLMDAGIIMYYFVEMAKTIGINRQWNITESVTINHDGKSYRQIGEFLL
ncbi:MAG: nitroreductase [Tissierellia bacterium]|nr:nitroreductase [Tissierellia bacterium]